MPIAQPSCGGACTAIGVRSSGSFGAGCSMALSAAFCSSIRARSSGVSERDSSAARGTTARTINSSRVRMRPNLSQVLVEVGAADIAQWRRLPSRNGAP